MVRGAEICSWAESADRSLAASLLLGRNSARAIAKAHLSELFRLVEGDRGQALAEITKVKSFGSRRLLMESFRLIFSLMHDAPQYHFLLEDTDLNDPILARRYDQALLKLLRENGNNKELLLTKLVQYPLRKRRIVSERLEHPDFRRSRRIKLSQNFFYVSSDSQSERGPLNWLQWIIIFLLVSMFALVFAN
jgi:hypothetical protein